MKLSYSWLLDFVDLEGLSPEAVAHKLTMGAFEVEEVEKVGPQITGPVVVGRIESISTHPDADKIRLTSTRIKEGDEPLQIVCGALNIEVGQKIPVALPGAVVLNRKTGEPLPIIASEIRGVKSNGMLCSPPELGITSGDSEGILVLPENGDHNLALGEDLIARLGLFPDWILHVEPRSNRGDALCVMGLAREVAALTGRTLKNPSKGLNENPFLDQVRHLQINIQDQNDCPYFSIARLDNIEVREAPEWMRRRLEAVGLRSVNNVVDITNYVMLELGQPLHAYDMSHLASDYLEIGRAKVGEKLEFIDSKQRELSEEILVIRDKNAIVGAAGIMGGKGSEISVATNSIALEAASFSAALVRRGSRILGLSSDSSIRFERGVDKAGVETALNRAVELMLEYCLKDTTRKTSGGLFAAGDCHVGKQPITVRLHQLKRLAEIDLSAQDCQKLLEPLGFEALNLSSKTIEVQVPSFRQDDVRREIDLIEEICRLYGYDNVPTSMPGKTVAPQVNDNLFEKTRQALTAQGLSEAWISSLRSASELLESEPSTVLRVLNPLSQDHQVLRQSLIPGLVEATTYNIDRGVSDVWLFELGRGYFKLPEPEPGTTGVEEYDLVAGIVTGSNIVQVSEGRKKGDTAVNEHAMTERVDFFRAKGLVENLLSSLGIPAPNLRYFRPESTPENLHPYRACQVAIVPALDNPADNSKKNKQQPQGRSLEKIGLIGELHPRILNNLDLRQTVAVFELRLD
ncbi:MAG: phenylalanine--tRNA ligase subunit beta, partial [Candidatus Obscuribacterales bacterium]|nr:phenylalanine--tRNA ligase subunit beta [Candidatus Obscuribacterales bacterium]